MRSLFTTILVIFLFSSTLPAQQTETIGNLLRINIFENEIDLSDTTGSWSTSSGSSYYSYSRYQKTFTFNENKYFLLDYHNDSQYLPTTGQQIESTSFEYGGKSIYQYFGYLDIAGPFLLENTSINMIENGVWITNGDITTHFLDISNNLFEEEREVGKILHIVGKIQDIPLAVTLKEFNAGEDDYQYQLMSLENSPQKIILNNIAIEYEGTNSDDYLIKLIAINDSVYFVSSLYQQSYFPNTNDAYCEFAYLQDTTLTVFSNFFQDNSLYYWTSFGNRIIGIRDSNLVAQTLNLITLQFEDIKIIATNVDDKRSRHEYSMSVDEKYSAFIRNDSLFAVSLENESIINSWDLQNIDNRYAPLIDSPYVYVHQATTIVGVEEENDLPKEITLSQNYPNPFNPTTTIKFTVPNVGTTHELSLRVYDILGREIKTLLHKPMQPGSYEVEFDGNNLTSGVYFYVLETGGKRLSRKMVLLK